MGIVNGIISWNVVFRSKKRAEVLGIITKDTFVLQLQEHMERDHNTSILGHILYESGADVTIYRRNRREL
jgi:UDP-N-acetylmuramate--alanine ligase